jgi:hypothetical protein
MLNQPQQITEIYAAEDIAVDIRFLGAANLSIQKQIARKADDIAEINVIERIAVDISDDTAAYLHRGTSGDDV